MTNKTQRQWEVSVRDNDGRVRTFTYTVLDRREALEEFKLRSGWSPRKIRVRLVRVAAV